MRGLWSVVVAAGMVVAGGASVAWSTSPHVAQVTPLQEAPAQEAPVAEDPELAKLLADGQTLFDDNCAECHGADLSGGIGPRLAGNERVGEDGVVLQMILLGGGYMPALGRLSNRRIAAIATYVRNTHDNAYGIVTQADVAAAR